MKPWFGEHSPFLVADLCECGAFVLPFVLLPGPRCFLLLRGLRGFGARGGFLLICVACCVAGSSLAVRFFGDFALRGCPTDCVVIVFCAFACAMADGRAFLEFLKTVDAKAGEEEMRKIAAARPDGWYEVVCKKLAASGGSLFASRFALLN